ncbi:MAG: ribbon-helix-helix domain-containing protein [Acidimicrobiales bacterium]|nr:ribbon-helix-helix domain-containing protein [Actinomycetota bacterium]
MAQLVTRVDDRLLAEVDDLVSAGVVRSRSEAVRLGLAVILEQHRRGRIGSAMADAYRRRPQTDSEVGWADAATEAMINREPW